MERLIEKSLYDSRWLLAPIYLGLGLALVAELFAMREAELILHVLTFIDLALIGGLLVMVMFSGYENFVSQIDMDEDQEQLNWLGKLDSGSLKQKVAASIVAISSIHLLKAFMNIEQIDNEKIMWYVIVHLTFVLSAWGMAAIDRSKPAQPPARQVIPVTDGA